MRHPSLKSKITNRFVIGISLSLTIMAATMIYVYYKSLEKQVVQYNKYYTRIISDAAVSALRADENLLKSLAILLESNVVAQSDYQKALTEIVEGQSSLVELRILDVDYRLQNIVPHNPEMIGYDMSAIKYAQEAKQTGQLKWSQAYLSVVTDTPVASLAVPFSHGVIMATFNFNTIYTLASEYKNNKEGFEIAVIDQGGTIVAHSNKENVAQRVWEPESFKIREQLALQDHKVTSIFTENQIITGKLIESTGWLIAVYQDKDTFISIVKRMSALLIAMSLFFIGCGVLIALRESNRVIDYFIRLTDDIKLLADGKYDKSEVTERFEELRKIEGLFIKTSHQISSRQKKINDLNLQLKEKLVLAENALTKQLEAEDNLALSHDRFKAVLDGINAAIYVSDMNTHEILFLNKFMREIYGDDFTGKPCWKTLKQRDGECEECTNSQLLDSDGQPTDGCSYQGQNPQSKRWFMFRDKAISWLDGNYVRLQVATDITDLKEMENKLMQTYKMEALGTLSGGIAHDFNNLLTAIIGYSELALDEISVNNKPAIYSVENILIASNRAKNIVQKLLAFSRKIEVQKKVISLSSLLDESFKILKVTLPSNIELRIVTNGVEGHVLAEPTEIQQVIINLVTNASQSLGQSVGLIRIELNRVEGTSHPYGLEKEGLVGPHIQLTISDSGPGISQEVLSKIFDPYFTTKEVGKGSGMGLSIVRGIISNHNGTISIHSELGKGTTAEIFLPECLHNTTKVEEKTGVNQCKGRGEKVLFIDDEKQLVRLLTSNLERHGYRVESETDPLEGFRRFEADPQSFDLVVTDMTMPQMTGLELTTKVLQLRDDIPVIICTGNKGAISDADIDELKVVTCLEKPVSNKEMLKIVRDVLNRAQK